MQTTHPPESHGPGHALERLIFFSDAVFAIAITLLIIEIHVPEVHPPFTDAAFLRALAPLSVEFLSFFVSFFVIGAFWAGHHRAFDCARHWSPKLVLPNLCMLSAVAAMPFFTAFSSEYYGHRVPSALYAFWMMLIALANIWVQRLATSPPVVGEQVSEAHCRVIRQRGVATLLGTTCAFAMALVLPFASQMTLATIPLWRMLLQRVSRPRG
ncbi:TMEM175 family protein [Sphingomonas azotifigens]|uniref:TMEM175 family protein n=1 Tax=Sphingomonas azotifigens TaxID=330920 RepID=UPI000A034E35|nr:TMEM175 family protein [Sphingomonas azotifigens]